MPTSTRASAISDPGLRRRVFRGVVPGWAGVVALGYLVLLTLVTLLAPAISPHDPLQLHPAHALQPPSREFPLGTDELGRDVLSRILYGGRISLRVGVAAVLLACLAGSTLGLVAGYAEGLLDRLIMRLTDIWLALPTVLLVLAIITALGPSIRNTTIAIAVSLVPPFTRVARGTTLSVKQNAYIEATRALGARGSRILLRHVVPNGVAPTLVYSTLAVASAILLTSGLSFIGLGAPPPAPEWGAMLASARTYIHRAWWMVTFPGLAISLTVLAINLVGDALRDVMDPRLRAGR